MTSHAPGHFADKSGGCPSFPFPSTVGKQYDQDVTNQPPDNGYEEKSLTMLLNRASSGDQLAAEMAWNSLQGDIRRLAEEASINEHRQDADLQPTIIMQEIWLKLFASHNEHAPDREVQTSWSHRGHFWGAVSQTMKRFLVDEARKSLAQKHAGSHTHQALQVTCGELLSLEQASNPAIIDLLEALDQLRVKSPEAAQVAEHRYLMGMSISQTAACLAISPRTVSFRWTYAQAWLRRALSEDHDCAAEAELT